MSNEMLNNPEFSEIIDEATKELETKPLRKVRNTDLKIYLNKGNIYTYSLKEGISEVMMAIDMMESYGFPENVVKDARLIVKKLNKRKYI